MLQICNVQDSPARTHPDQSSGSVNSEALATDSSPFLFTPFIPDVIDEHLYAKRAPDHRRVDAGPDDPTNRRRRILWSAAPQADFVVRLDSRLTRKARRHDARFGCRRPVSASAVGSVGKLASIK